MIYGSVCPDYLSITTQWRHHLIIDVGCSLFCYPSPVRFPRREFHDDSDVTAATLDHDAHRLQQSRWVTIAT